MTGDNKSPGYRFLWPTFNHESFYVTEPRVIKWRRDQDWQSSRTAQAAWAAVLVEGGASAHKRCETPHRGVSTAAGRGGWLEEWNRCWALRVAGRLYPPQFILRLAPDIPLAGMTSAKRRAAALRALAYAEYLKRVRELARMVAHPGADGVVIYPASISTRAIRALYDNLDRDEDLAIRIDTTVRHTKKDGWVGNKFKEREVANAIREELGEYHTKLDEIVELVKNQDEYQ